MVSTISPEEMERYRAGARAREAARQQAVDRRREAAWHVARRAAQLLREKYGATRVVLFGSLAHGAWFHMRSDVDIAVSGIAGADYWRAGSELERLDPEIEIDLVVLDDAPDRLRAEIEQGVEL